MNCWDARELLLEADPAELNCTVASEIVDHLKVCDSCRALAVRILQAESALETELAIDFPPLAV